MKAQSVPSHTEDLVHAGGLCELGGATSVARIGLTMFEHRLAPQFYDFDMGGVAHNVVYVRWLEDVRLAFLHHSGWPIERLQTWGVLPAVTRTEIDYKRPVRPGDALLGRVAVTKAGRSQWGLAITLLSPDTGTVYAEAHQNGCFVAVPAMRPAAMPLEFAAFLKAHMA